MPLRLRCSSSAILAFRIRCTSLLMNAASRLLTFELGGALGKVSSDIETQLQALRPDDKPARWAFRWVGSYPNILTALSGMNNMQHLIENVETFSPLDPCTEAENQLLEKIAALSLRC